MEPSPLWQEEPVAVWLSAMLLPVTPWAKQLLPQLGLPEKITENPKILNIIHEKATQNYDELLQSLNLSEPVKGLEAFLSREVVTAAISHLADVIGLKSAKRFENWARRNIVRRDWSYSLLCWHSSLCRATGQGTQGVETITPPSSLSSLFPDIIELINFEKEESFETELKYLATMPSEEESSLGLKMCNETMIFEEVARNEWTFSALKLIAQSITQAQRAEVVEWAKLQTALMGLEPNAILQIDLVDYGL